MLQNLTVEVKNKKVGGIDVFLKSTLNIIKSDPSKESKEKYDWFF